MKPPYLGRISLWWCGACNLPLLGKKCSLCGRRGEKVEVSPPGDVRPAFKGDIELINSTTEEQFGAPLVEEDKVCLLNKSSGLDRFDELIQDGRVLGSLAYEVERREFKFLPSLEGGSRLYSKAGKKYVSARPEVLKFLERGSLLMPGVEGFDRGIERGEEVIVVSEDRVVGVGKARLSGREAEEREKGMFVKLRKFDSRFEPRGLSAGGELKMAVEANREALEGYEEKAIGFIQRLAQEHSLPRVVAFSGGKDSLATLILVSRALEDYKVLFTDTGIEFPETEAQVEEVVPGERLITARAGRKFWRGVEDVFGFPARDYRWCCKVVKLGPTARAIKENFPQGCLSFIGQRRYESQTRARSKAVWRNPWIPSQLAASPIQNWSALVVWLYLLRERANVNPLYSYGFERLGCFTCPASDLAELEMVKKIHPELYSLLEGKLKEEFTSDQVELGLWRWRSLPRGQKMMSLSQGVEMDRKPVKYTVPYSRKDGIYRLYLPIQHWKAFVNMARAVGGKEEGGYLRLKGLKVYPHGSIIAGDLKPKKLKKVLEEVVACKERAELCLGCGVCLAQCKQEAIELGEKAALLENCLGCSRCHFRCPVVRYREREVVLERR